MRGTYDDLQTMVALSLLRTDCNSDSFKQVGLKRTGGTGLADLCGHAALLQRLRENFGAHFNTEIRPKCTQELHAHEFKTGQTPLLGEHNIL